MYCSSRIAAAGILAVAFFLVMFGFGSAELQAQHHDSNKGCGCQAAPVEPPPCECKPLEPLPAPCGCPAPTISRPCVTQPEGCSIVDPKEVRRLKKEAEHAQHEAAEACQRQHEAGARAQKRIDEAADRGQRDIDRAQAHVQHEVGEWSEAVAKYNSLGGSQGVSAETPTE
jgi:hypothetical protein